MDGQRHMYKNPDRIRNFDVLHEEGEMRDTFYHTFQSHTFALEKVNIVTYCMVKMNIVLYFISAVLPKYSRGLCSLKIKRRRILRKIWTISVKIMVSIPQVL